MTNQPIYADGLRFSCTRCSSCCRHESGYVFLSENDISVLASGLKIGYTDFLDRYCRWVKAGAEERLSLKEKSNYDCIFWDQFCVVYRNRPLQCRAFPFWNSILRSREAWDAEALNCPGINKGAMHERAEIEDFLARRALEKVIERFPK